MSLLVVVPLLLIAEVFPVGALTSEGTIALASSADDGTKGNGTAYEPSLSADGNKVAFRSRSNNLDPADSDFDEDVFVKDLVTGDIKLASAADDGTDGNGDSNQASLSADGTKIAFVSLATNLDPADADTSPDLYVKDLVTGDIKLASAADDGTKANGGNFGTSLSADGTRVAFTSEANNLDSADSDVGEDVYVKNLTTGDIALASTADDGTKANSASFDSFLSADGTTVAFSSFATNLNPADNDATVDVYVKDLASGAITLCSSADDGTKGNDHSFARSLSADGTQVAFASLAFNLDPADIDNAGDVYVKDVGTGDIMLASRASDGTKGNGLSGRGSLSADGSKVAFHSFATNLVPSDGDAMFDVYVKDLATGDITLATTASDGTKGNGSFPSLSADGTRVAFESSATNFSPADTDSELDVYVKDLAECRTGGLSGNGTIANSFFGTLEEDGPLSSAIQSVEPALGPAAEPPAHEAGCIVAAAEDTAGL